MKLASRILIALFAVAGAIGWAWLVLALMRWGNSLGGMGDGAGTESRALPPLAVLIIAAIWLIPTMAFVFMLLSALNVLKGAMRQVAYWYALIFLVIASFVLAVLFPRSNGVLKLIGLACMLFAGLWGFAFRGNINDTEKQTPV
jgi:hypothetical protein